MPTPANRPLREGLVPVHGLLRARPLRPILLVCCAALAIPLLASAAAGSSVEPLDSRSPERNSPVAASVARETAADATPGTSSAVGPAATPSPVLAVTSTPASTFASGPAHTTAATAPPASDGTPKRVTATAPASAAQTALPTPAATPTPEVQAPDPTPVPTPVAAPSPTRLPAGFVGRSGTQFVLGGRPFTFTGFNIYEANSRSNCSYTMGTGSKLDSALEAIGPGAEVFRAWFFQYEATADGQRDWSAFDHTLAVARAHGVKVIATLGDQWGSCESQTSVYKDDAWYAGGYKTVVLPGTSVPYRQWVADVVARYANDPTIAMWQLMNEAEIKVNADAPSCADTADLYDFAADVSGLVKSIDTRHLVNLGTIGGGQCGSQGGDYKLINSIATLDVCEFHDYGQETVALPATLAADIAACNSLGKPIFVGEAGIKATSVGGTLTARAAAFDAKCEAMFRAGVRGFLVWSWNESASNTADWDVGPGDPTIGVVDGY